MQLPHADKAKVDRTKIQDYLLSLTHPEGWSKAEFFSRLGYSADRWQVLADALKKHGQECPVADQKESPYGIRYTVEGWLEGPAGQKAKVRTVWIVERGKEIPRLITAYPV